MEMLDWIDYLNINDNYIGNETNKNCIKFIFLWIRYNNYYNKKYTKEINKKYKEERIRAKALNCDKVQRKYSEFKEEFLNSFKSLSNQDTLKEYITNLKTKEIILFNEHNSDLDDFLDTVYQIRCNLFHGDKLARDYDAKIVSWAYECLNKLLNDTIF